MERTKTVKKENAKMEARELVFPEVCTQPQCMLRDKGFDSEFSADLILRLLSGEDIAVAVPADRRIVGIEHCRRCVLSVLRDGRPLATAEELKELVESGQRSHRRYRRWRRHTLSVAGRKGGEALLITLADLARTKPKAFDRLMPTIMKKAEQALQGV